MKLAVQVQALKGANGETVYVLMADDEEIDSETAELLAASVASGDFDVAESGKQKEASADSEKGEQKDQQRQQQQQQQQEKEHEKCKSIDAKGDGQLEMETIMAEDEAATEEFIISSD
ncbi:unnamed protein product [Gongylonema pulchrum]|uniref:EF-hand domain-containing protein n=1 Tax=Gongylonema pulchrum TaxID=637853 RepID=A0A183D362_9BILA|nr:unnamed protein product [Gongylonema pulchrum]